MSTKIYCPECQTRVDESFITCPNCSTVLNTMQSVIKTKIVEIKETKNKPLPKILTQPAPPKINRTFFRTIGYGIFAFILTLAIYVIHFKTIESFIAAGGLLLAFKMIKGLDSSTKPIREIRILFGILIIVTATSLYLLQDEFVLIYRKAGENTTKKELEQMRLAVSNYQIAHLGNLPKNPTKMLAPKYIKSFPKTKLNYLHEDSSNIFMTAPSIGLTDQGGWAYDIFSGRIYVNCTHTDTLNKPIKDW